MSGFFDRAWRLTGTAASFILFGLGGLVLGLVVFPLLSLVVWNRQRRSRIARRILQAGFRFYIGFMNALVLSYTVTGRQNIPASGGYMIVANHPSLIDVIFLLALFDRADCVVKQEIRINPFTLFTVRATDYVPNADAEYVLNECVARVETGDKLILFPEGTRTVPGKPVSFKRGAASIAIRAGAPILPVRIRVEPTTLTKGRPWYDIPASRPHFALEILPPIDSASYLESHGSERRASFDLNQDLQRLLA